MNIISLALICLNINSALYEPNSKSQFIEHKRISQKVRRSTKPVIFKARYMVYNIEQKQFLKSLFSINPRIKGLELTNVFLSVREMPNSNPRMTRQHVLIWFKNERHRQKRI
jgi:hypothetical protein